MNDLISIIVPVYNLENILQKTVISILNQTYTHMEIILVDDGSTDQSLVVMKQLALNDNRIIVLHQANSGVLKARLAGINAANGQWIGFVDGDDIIEQDMFERLLSNAYLYNAQISHCGYRMVFPDREDLYYGTGNLLIQNNQEALYDLISGSRIDPGVWNKLFSRNLFINAKLCSKMDCDLRNMEDLLMNFYLFQAATTVVYEDICPYHYIIRKGSAATSPLNEHKLKDPLKILEIIREEVTDYPELMDAIELRILKTLIRISSMQAIRHTEMVKPFRTYARKKLRKRLRYVLKLHGETKLKIMAVFAAFFPSGYGFIHRCYERITKLYKKYAVS